MKPEELKKLTKSELYRLAKEEGLRVTSRMLKAEIYEILERHFNKSKRRKAAAGPKKTGRTTASVKGKAPKGKETKPRSRKKVSLKASEKQVVPEHPESIREEVERGKYYLGEEEIPVEGEELPEGYGLDRIVTMVRDPNWIFSYWEVTRETLDGLRKKLGDRWEESRLILRVFDRSGPDGGYFDIELNGDARNWYINVAPERRYQVAIGALDPDGNFHQIAVSNLVETPRGRISDVVDDRWMIPEEIFEKIFAASGGHDMHAASIELRKLLEQRLLEEMGSGAVSSFGSGAVQKP